jgi:hypothetical protein
MRYGFRILVRKPEGEIKIHLEDLGVAERIILK